MILDIGCGDDKQPDAIGLDKVFGTEADVIADIEHGLPFRSDTFDLIMCKHVLEHVDCLVSLMEQIWRVARPGAEVVIEVPHFASVGAYQDPTHTRFFSSKTFEYFSEGHPYGFYSRARFVIKRRRIVTTRVSRLLGMEYVANLVPYFYDNNLCYVLRPSNIRLRLECVK